MTEVCAGYKYGAKVRIIRSGRKTVGIQLKAGEICVRAPLGTSEAEVNRILEQKKDWIEKNLRILSERRSMEAKAAVLTPEELKALSKRAKEVIPAKADRYAAMLGVTYGRITIRAQRSRWGSCSGKGNLNFNCLLMLMPEEILDSIVAHELCHRRHMNHSADFYRELERIYPNYKKCRAWLKENGAAYLARLPK